MSSSVKIGLTPEQIEKCLALTQKIYDLPFTTEFRMPVDRNITAYYETIQNPISLSEIIENLKNNEYKSIDQWKEDMKRVWTNAMEFNKEVTVLYQLAKYMKEYYRSKIDSISKNDSDKWRHTLKYKMNKLIKLLDNRPRTTAKIILKKSSH